MTACTDDERRRVAAALRGLDRLDYSMLDIADIVEERYIPDFPARLADLIEPSYKPDAKYEAWYNSLSHYGGKRGGPATIRELIEEIVWAALTVDLGPNGNTDPSTGTDEGDVYTNKLFSEWESEALRLSGGIDREALLALADEMDGKAASSGYFLVSPTMRECARRIREALGVSDDA